MLVGIQQAKGKDRMNKWIEIWKQHPADTILSDQSCGLVWLKTSEDKIILGFWGMDTNTTEIGLCSATTDEKGNYFVMRNHIFTHWQPLEVPEL
jgi:hypothetical protein